MDFAQLLLQLHELILQHTYLAVLSPEVLIQLLDINQLHTELTLDGLDRLGDCQDVSSSLCGHLQW